MELHETLYELGTASGRGVFDDADLLRAALDDYLDEGAASTGDINLLVDAVRLGALRMMLSTIDSGAEPARAVEAAGEMLARDRGTSDVVATRWACAVLGFAVGRVSATDVQRFQRHATQPRPSTPPPAAATQAPAAPWPVQSPTQSPPQPPPTSPPYQQPYAAAGYPAAPYAAGPPPKKKRTGLLVAIGALALVVVGGILTVVLLNSGGDDGKDTATDPTSASTEPTEEPTEEPTDEPTEEPTGVPAGAIEGTGYYFELPDGWSDITAEVLETEGAGQTDLAVAWGKSFDGARANMIVETAFAGGETDPEALRTTWQNNMAGATGATPQDNGTTVIDGEDAVGALIARVNENDVAIEQFGYLTIHDGDLYSVILSTQAGDTKAQDFYEQILESWTWAS